MNQQSAQGLASLGRGPDSMLVHMAPGEVKSLQQLAMAHGGSLTINPETGLPEAGFLSSLLPMLIGGGLTVASGGALSPLMAGLITGGGYGLATGSLKKGLMAGFGAYGGAGLGSALAGAGATQGLIAGNAASQTAMGSAANAKDLLLARGAETAAPGMFGNAAANFSNAGAGITGLGSEAGRNAFMSQIGGAKGLGMAGLAAAAPMMMQTTTQQPEIKSDANMGQRYKFDAGALTPTPPPDVPGYNNQGQNFGKERQYFNPMYRPIDNDAARKLYGFASGGPVEAMSDANSIGMNTGYPQADITTGAYATPYQQPISRDMLPYAGQPQFAEGGEVDSYTYDPVTQMYTKKGGEGATMVSPVGGISGASAGGVDAVQSGWDKMSDAEKAAYYAENPTMAGITQLGQKGFGLTSAGMAQNYLFPEFVERMSTIARGYDPANLSYGGGSRAEQNALQAAMSSPNTGVGIPGESAGIGEGIGGGDISGQSEGTPALAQGGIANLGDYSDGGRLLRGPGDGVAELPDGAFVVPARITSEIGNGSTNAGAQELFAMEQRLLGKNAQPANLGRYSGGGNLVRGKGDGVSDSVPATIGKRQPARIADGETIISPQAVKKLGNGSTEAGARKLYAMMDRVQKARKKTVGKGKVAANSRSAKYLPA